MSTETPNSASESEENTQENYQITPSTPPPSPSRARLNREQPSTNSMTIRLLMTRPLARSPVPTATEYSPNELVPPPSGIHISDLYQHYRELYRASFPNVSQIVK